MFDSGVEVFFPSYRHFVKRFAGRWVDGVASLRCWDNLIVDDIAFVGLYIVGLLVHEYEWHLLTSMSSFDAASIEPMVFENIETMSSVISLFVHCFQ